MPKISVEIEGMSSSLIVDTGSNISILQASILKSDVQVTALEPYGVTGDVLEIRGQQSVTLMLNGSEFKHSFLVCTLPTKAAGLLGTDFLDRLGARIDFECGQMTLTGIRVVLHVHCIPSTEHVALTAFSEGKEGCSPQPKKCEAGHMDEQLPAHPRTELTTLPDKSWIVRSAQNVTMPPRCRQIIVGALEAERDQDLPPLVCVEPAHIPTGVVPARGLSRVDTRVNEHPRIMSRDIRDISTA